MRFGPIPLAQAVGAVLAHSVRRDGVAFHKGRVLTADDAAALAAAGVEAVTVARPDPDDCPEDEAAARVARAVAGERLTVAAAFTGRANLFAAAAGLLVVDRAAAERINGIDESVTLATLPELAAVEAGQMAATVKIIPFAAPLAAVEAAEAAAREMTPVLRVAPYRPLSAVLIQTVLPGMKESVLDKTREVTARRLASVGGTLREERRCPHEGADLAAAIAAAGPADLLLIAGASAIADRRDVIPAAVEAAGGVVERFGMPVDPGNLLLLARIGATPVLGLPGCARSPKLNGFDWVLQRIAAGILVDGAAIARMGVGGLLAEIPTRPLPRAVPPQPTAPQGPMVAAVVLAAGRSTRMGGANKLLADINGAPLVVRTVDAVLSSRARPVVVVTGHDREAVEAALAGRPATFVHNPAFAEGLSSSLRAGIRALPAEAGAAVVCLGDMPLVSGAVIDRLIAAYAPLEGRAICVPVVDAKRGNPVLWDRAFFDEVASVAGDAGARHLIGLNAERVCEVPAEDDAVLTDVDTPDAVAAVRRRLGG